MFFSKIPPPKRVTYFLNGPKVSEAVKISFPLAISTIGESIWPLVYNATEHYFGIELGYEDMLMIEQDIQSLATHTMSCTKIHSKKSKAECLVKILAILDQNMHDLSVEHDIETVNEELAVYIMSRTAVTAMDILVLTIMENYLDYIKGDLQRKEAKEKMVFFYRKNLQEMDKASAYSIGWRRDQVTAVVICSQHEYFWQNFTGICETRWKRDEIPNKRDETEKDEKDVFEEADMKKAMMKKVEAIGHAGNEWQVMFEAKVTDTITDEVIYEKSVVSDTASKGRSLDKLVLEGTAERSEYDIALAQELRRFMNSTYFIMQDTFQAKLAKIL